MQLEEIKKNCKVITNEEKRGEELYFDTKPSYDIIKELKQNGYRWHNAKKCWYRRLSYTGIGAEKTNYLGVKIGDIFHYSWGYEQTNCDYFQVVALKGTKQVVIREIGYEITETTAIDSYRVKAVNENGAIKQVKGLKNGTIYINIESFGFCSLWDGTDDLMTCYY